MAVPIIPTGLVTGQYFFVSEDNIDLDTDPQLVPVSGVVRFTASVKTLTMPGDKAVVIPLVFEGKFDTAGNLVPKDGTGIGMKLPATDSDKFTETDYTWRVEFDLRVVATGHTVNLAGWDFQVPEGSNQDLSNLMPVDASPGVLTLRGPKGDASTVPGPPGVVEDSSVAAVITAPLTAAALSTTIGQKSATLFVESYAQPGDASDDLAWQRAVNAAKASGAKQVQGTKAVYIFAAPVKLGGTTGLTIAGTGADRTIIKAKAGSTVSYAFVVGQGEGNVKDLTITDLGADGNMTSVPVGLSRDRSYTSTRLEGLLRVNSNLVPGQGSTHPTVQNVTATNLHMYGLKELPLFISGVTGRVLIEGVSAERCLDIGVTHSENYHFVNNHVLYSADNGVSLSRGNVSVVCVGNTFTNSWFWGIHAAGWDGEIGPDTVTITGNTILTSGYGGIYLGLAPKNVSVVGNTVRGMMRGATNNTPDYGVGIYVTGYGPTDIFGAPTIYAENINIVGNTLVDCARGGIAIWSTKNALVSANMIIRPGTEKLPDGSTVSSNDGWQNFGIATPGSSAPGNGYKDHVFNIKTTGNLIIDDRPTPYMKHGTYHTSIPAAQWTDSDNTVVGAANAYTELLPPAVFASSVRVGYSSGTTSNLLMDGPATITRQLMFRTGTSNRWAMRATNGTESGTTVGTDLQLVAYENDGSTQRTVCTLTRSGQFVFNGTPRLPQFATASRPSASGVGAGAMVWDSSLGKPIWSNGTAWVGADGATL